MDNLRPVITRLLPIIPAARALISSAKLPLAKALAPTVGPIVAGTVVAFASNHIYWLLSYPTYGIGCAASLFGRGRLTFQLLRGVKDIWSSGAKVFNNRFGNESIQSLSGDALQTEKNRVKELAERMQNCAKAIGSLSLWWGACGILGFEEAGDLTPFRPFSVPALTTLCLTGIVIASLNFLGVRMLNTSTHSTLVMPTKAANDTLVELVPKVLEAARANQHIGASKPDEDTLKRATVAYLLCSLGPTEAKKYLGAFAVRDSLFNDAHREIPTNPAARNRMLSDLIRGDARFDDWDALMRHFAGNTLLDACVDDALS